MLVPYELMLPQELKAFGRMSGRHFQDVTGCAWLCRSIEQRSYDARQAGPDRTLLIIETRMRRRFNAYRIKGQYRAWKIETARWGLARRNLGQTSRFFVCHLALSWKHPQPGKCQEHIGETSKRTFVSPNSLKFETAFVHTGGRCWYVVSSIRTGSIQTIQTTAGHLVKKNLQEN